jgi:hypothetical protein
LFGVSKEDIVEQLSMERLSEMSGVEKGDKHHNLPSDSMLTAFIILLSMLIGGRAIGSATTTASETTREEARWLLVRECRES